jgi:hypothetical protein
MQINITPVEKTTLDDFDAGCTFYHKDSLYIVVDGSHLDRLHYTGDDCYDILAVNLETGELCAFEGDTKVIAKSAKVIDD